MAAIAFFFLLTLTLTSTIHARESQFFNKFNTNTNTINNPKEESQPLNTNQQDPNFVPQSQESGGSYGLYGHESGQLPPTTTTNNNNYLPANLPENYNPVAYTTPIHSSTQDIPEEYREDPQTYNGETGMYNSQKQEKFMGTNGDNLYNSGKQEEFTGTNGDHMYSAGKQGMSDTRFLENGKYYYAGDNAYNSQKQGFDDTRFMETEDTSNMYSSQKQGVSGRYNQGEEMYNSGKQGMGEVRYSTTNTGNMYDTEKQGMSDTRFLENGKYYYDLNMENQNLNANMNLRGSNSRNGYNTQGYYGNNENSYDRYNSNGGYENQEELRGDQFNP